MNNTPEIRFDRVNGKFTTRLPNGKSGCTFQQRFVFMRAKWTFDKTNGAWTTTNVEYAKELNGYAVGAAKEHLDNVRLLEQQIVAASWAEDTDTVFPSPEGLTYMPFQKAGIEYALERAATLIADPPGLGKTIQAIGVHNARRAKKILVICPASLKVNWNREWVKWDVHGVSTGIAHSKTRTKTVNGVTDRWTEYNFPDTDMVVVNYDMLDTFDDQIKSIEWDLIIADECHLLKSPEAVRTMCVFGGKRKALRKDGKLVRAAKTYTPIMYRKLLLLTGTPILSRPIELWNILRACDPKGLGASWSAFAYRYCDAEDGYFGVEAKGASNLEELSRILRERFMVRRDKRAVLKELPDKTREPIMLPQDKLEKIVKKEKTRMETALLAYEKVLGIDTEDSAFRFIQIFEDLGEKLEQAIDAQTGEEPDWDKAIKSLSPPDQIMFTEMSEAREEVALAKVGMVTDHVKKLVESEEPVILFAYHKSVVKALQERLTAAGVSVGVITGNVDSKKRQKIVDDFQSGKYDVILGNIVAMGVGFTLTRGRFVVFAELDWVPSMMEQAEDRAWRHGQLNAVIAQYLLVDGSIESIMAVSILQKMGVIMEALDSGR